jgi:chromosome segregation ATPase
MEYLPLVLDGIENKVKKLVFSNQQLKEENRKISELRDDLQSQVSQLKEKIAELEDRINKLKVTKVLTGEDTLQARLQINELLREIDKCYSLLNR